MIRGSIIYLLLYMSLCARAQQVAQYSQWSFNQFAINPAMAGLKNCLDVRAAYRMQWAGFEGAPQTGLFTINAPIKARRKKFNSPYHGLGAKIERDQFGHFNNFAISGAYAVHFPIGREKRLSFGVLAGIQQFGFDQSNVTTIDPDLAVGESSSNFMFPLLGFGGWYNSKNFFVGISMDQLARNRWGDIGFNSRFGLHTKLTSGTRITFDNKNSVLPAILIRIPPKGPASIDLNLMFDFTDKFLVGLGYRNTDALIAMARLRLEKFSVGYSFDFITSDIRGGNFHTHEISLMYNTCRSRGNSTSACPLFE
jgi:type IX secretion system PorP/SprF family membrane protein